jgi:hypothetical protein
MLAHTTTTTPLPIRFAVALLAGLGAALVMNIPVNVLSRGHVPLDVAASALWRRPVESVTVSETDAVHYAAGMAAGALFELLLVIAEAVRPTVVDLAGLVTLSEIVAALLVAALVYGVFAFLVVPRYGGEFYEDETERRTVTRQWAVCAATYGIGILVMVPVVYVLLPV